MFVQCWFWVCVFALLTYPFASSLCSNIIETQDIQFFGFVSTSAGWRFIFFAPLYIFTLAQTWGYMHRDWLLDNVDVRNSVTFLIETPRSEWGVDLCGFNNGYQEDVFKRDWTVCSEFNFLVSKVFFLMKPSNFKLFFLTRECGLPLIRVLHFFLGEAC